MIAFMRIAMILLSVQCSPSGVLRLGDVEAPMPYLAPAAAISYMQVRHDIYSATGIDALGSLGDALRSPSFTTNKPGVAFRSWHKAGRAIDVDQRYGWYVVPEGRFYRLWLNGVDVTAIFEAHGWNRIPAVGDVPEWWHYEYIPDGLTWQAAMQQTWAGSETLLNAVCWDATPAVAPSPIERSTPPPSVNRPIQYKHSSYLEAL